MKLLSKRLLGALMAIIMMLTILPNNIFKVTAVNASAQSTISTGSIIVFGSYPQTKVTSSALISALNAQTLQSDNTVTYNGLKYARVYFAQYMPYYTTAPTTAEYSYQDDNGYNINTVYWFKYEPLQWFVLSNTNGELLVMANKILDSRAYNQVHTDVTWETCTMRYWLNNDFYNAAFNSTEQAKIETSTLVNANNPRYGTNGGNNTNDNLFLLSYADTVNTAFGFSSDYTNYDEARMTQGTDYAKSSGLYVPANSSNLGNSSWWLRSPGFSPDGGGVVNNGGDVGSYIYDFVNLTDIGVRPAFKINRASIIFVSSVTLSKSSETLITGKTLQLTATVNPSNANYRAVAWKSSSSAALVTSAGFVTANAVGTAIITCSAQDGSGIKATCKITVIPKTPTNLKAVKATSTSIKLTWTAVSGATGYYIYRSNSSTGPYTKIKGITGSNTFTNTGLTTKGKTYYYKVQAYKTVGANLYSGGLSNMAYAKV